MLIKCPECNHDVSDRAKFCPQCGYPISEMNDNVVNSLEKEECPICSAREHITMNGNDVCKQCGYIFSRKTYNTEEKREVKLSSEECPICKCNNHLLKDDNDICAECGYIYKRNLSSPVGSVQNGMQRDQNAIHCKYCGSTNVKKLGWIVGQKARFGGLQWHCNNCGSDF